MKIEDTYTSLKSPERIKALDLLFDQMYLVAKVSSISYLVAEVLFVLPPLYSYIFDGKLVLIFEIVAPFVNPTTAEGYLFLSAIHIIWMVFGLPGMVGLDVTFFSTCFHVVSMTELFKFDLLDVSKYLEENYEEILKGKNKKNLKIKLKEIYGRHREILT